MDQHTKQRWRFLEVDWLTYAQTAVFRPTLLKTVSERIVPDTLSFCSFPSPSVVLNFFNDPDKDIDLKFCRQRDIPVYRVISSGGPIFGDTGYIFVFIHAARDSHGIPSTVKEMFAKTLSSIAHGLSECFDIEVRFRPLNDLEAKGTDGVWRKIGPSSCFYDNQAIQMGSGIQIHQPDLDLMASIITPPPEKFLDKQAKSIQERVTCLDNIVGRRVEIREIKQIYVTQMEKTFGVELSQGGLSRQELDYLKKFEDEYTSEDFLMDRSEKRLDPLPEGIQRRQLQYKISGGPLIRIICFIKGRRIWRIIITGSIHASPLWPSSPVHEIENALVETPIDRKVIRDRLIRVMERPNYEMPGVIPEELAEKIELCCMKDYTFSFLIKKGSSPAY